MHLENNYYKLLSMRADGLGGLFHIALLPDCEVYRGHFPGNPVCPGVMNIQTVKVLAERLAGRRLQISTIRQCRLTAVATPSVCPELDVRVSLSPVEGGYSVSASLSDDVRTYLDFKGIMN